MTREEARAFIAAIVSIRENATDEQALKSIDVYPAWKAGITYETDSDDKRVRIRHGKVLYKCRQKHTAQEDWEPDKTPALWVAISLEAGTQDKPITAVRGMEYEEGKYYLDTDDGKTYLCTRSGILQYLPHELIGQYFEK